MKKLSKREESSPTDKIPGGLGQFTEPKDVDSKELDAGIEIEYEHNSNTEIAQDIALDHLTEIPDYYTRLEKMEDSAKEDGVFKDIKRTCCLIKRLVKISNSLDSQGLYAEADKVDELIKMASMAQTNMLIKALKSDDLETAKNIMSHISASDLQLTTDDFRTLMNFLHNGDLAGARGLLNIVKGNPDLDLGRPTVSPHLKDVFIPETLTVRDIVEGKVRIDDLIKES
ncbi:MAG: DUF5661 family protein [Patescibacteria group bacterium]